MKKRILLTGASGTIGFEVLKALVSQSGRFQTTVFDLETPKSKRLFSKFGSDIKVFFGDISDPEATVEASKNQDFVIHLAALIPPAAYRDPEVTDKINFQGTASLVANLEKYAAGAFIVFSSSVAVYGDRLAQPNIRVSDPLQPGRGDVYGETKVKAEALIKNCRLRWSIFRLSAIMGAGNHKISGLMFLMPLETPMEITTPEDAARAFVNSIDHEKQLEDSIFNLGGGTQNLILYRDFLQRSFDAYGLGKLSFPEHAFARRNYHCGYYSDGDDLENILHFRRDTMESYFLKVTQSVPAIRRFFTRLLQGIVKKRLLKLSAPYAAYQSGDPEKMKDYF